MLTIITPQSVLNVMLTGFLFGIGFTVAQVIIHRIFAYSSRKSQP